MSEILRDAGVRHDGDRQVAHDAARGLAPRRVAQALAARARLRALLRLLRRRDAPVLAGARARQPLHRGTGRLRGGLPPHRGSRRPCDRVAQRPARRRSHQAVLPLLRDRRVPLAAPRTTGVDREVPGPLRPGLGPVARGDVRPSARAGHRPGGHGALTSPRLGAGLGLARRRRQAAQRTLHGVLRGVPVARRRADRSRRRAPRGARRAREHDPDPRERQRRELGGRAAGLDQRRAHVEHGPGRQHRDGRPHRRARRPHAAQQLPVGLDHGRLHAVAPLEARGARGRRGRPVHRPLPRRHPDARRAAAPVRPRHRRRADDPRHRRRHLADRHRRRDAVAGRGPELRSHLHRRRTPRHATRSTSRCSARARSTTTAGRR